MAFVKQRWLNAEASPVVTDAEEVPGTTTYGLQVDAAGSPSNFNIFLEGSLDGVDWFTLLAFSLGTGGNPRLEWVTGKPVTFIRINFAGFSGGSSPTMTASVIAV